MGKFLSIEFEKAVRLLVEYFPISNEDSRKPILFHDIRVGTYLYENGYSEDIIVAGVLHDAIEWSDITKAILQAEFGNKITTLILANTKNKAVEKNKRNRELIKRCAQNGQNALIIKSADIIDSFKWYVNQNNQEQLMNHCVKNAELIFKYKPENFNDRIFDELEKLTENLIISNN